MKEGEWMDGRKEEKILALTWIVGICHRVTPFLSPQPPAEMSYKYETLSRLAFVVQA
jgi:hypothetical protein